jgi:hypothetical protein
VGLLGEGDSGEARQLFERCVAARAMGPHRCTARNGHQVMTQTCMISQMWGPPKFEARYSWWLPVKHTRSCDG